MMRRGEPTAGDIVWCRFPDHIHPRPEPRPALVMTVYDDDAPAFSVKVVCGTSQKTTTFHRGEFAILRERHLAAYQAAGLSFDTKFNLGQIVTLPHTTEWLSVPPAAPNGQMPKCPNWAYCTLRWFVQLNRRLDPSVD